MRAGKSGDEPMRSKEPRLLDPATALARIHEFTVLDVRPGAAFLEGHLDGSGNIALADFGARRPELPPRDRPILVVAESGPVAATAARELAALGFARVSWLDAPLSSLERGLASRGPAARVSRPAQFLEEVLPLIPRGLAADLAAGAGREAVFLAMNGFEVEAWDRDPEALARAASLAARHGVAIETVACDLESPAAPLPADRYRLVVCFRFLHRPLLPSMVRALAPCGYLVYETYRVGQERLGRPRRRQFLLESGELRRAFDELEILRYEEPEPAGGPVTARLLARRSR